MLLEKYDLTIFMGCLVYMIISLLIIKNNRLKKIHFVMKNKNSIDKIRNLIKDNNTDSSQHIWNEDINQNIQTEIQIINNEILDKLGSKFKYIPSMTEIYYSAKENKNSDKHFTATHVDGPFYKCDIYRALVCISGNKSFFTNYIDSNEKHNLKKYDIVLFDYNRELHNIEVDSSTKDKSQRIILKMHYSIRSDNNLCEKYHRKWARNSRNVFEKNKKNLYISGIFSYFGQIYYTNRKNVCLLFAILLYGYYKSYFDDTKYKNKTRAFFYVICLIEISIFIYTLNYHFINEN